MPGVDVTLRGVDAAAFAEGAAEAERLNVDGVFATESANDPFVSAALGVQATSRITVGTAIALAFPRSPMDVAYSAWDLQRLSGGRFVLGLGSQVRAHVERRYSAPFGPAAARMREFVGALRAIFAAWQDGTPLDFRGAFYSHTLMPDNFRPAPLETAPPPIHLAAVRPWMLRTAAAVADGILLHAFCTPEHLRGSVLPAIERGLEEGDRDRGELTVTYGAFLATGEAEWEAARRRVAFYGSTPGYRDVLETHGRGDLADALHARSRAQEWRGMAELVDDELLDRFCVRAATHEAAAAELLARVGPEVDRIGLTAEAGVSVLAPAVATLRRNEEEDRVR